MKRMILCLGLLLSVMPLLMAQSEPSTKKVAILEVVDRDNTVNYGVKLLLRTALSKAITQTPGYEGYDRVDMSAIQGEQDFQRTGMVSDEQIKRLGEMTGAAYVLVAEVAQIDATTMIVTAKILDVETAKLDRTDYEQMGMDAQKMANGCRVMANRLLRVSTSDMRVSTSDMRVSTPNDRKIEKEKSETGGKLQEFFKSLTPKEKDKKRETKMETGADIIRRGSRLFIEDGYGYEKIPKAQERKYLGNYFGQWEAAVKKRNAGIWEMAVGSIVFAVGIPLIAAAPSVGYDYWEYSYGNSSFSGDVANGKEIGLYIAGGALAGIGIGLLAAGIPTYIKAGKKMDGILQMATEQRGVAPYRTEVSFNLGNQPHGIGLGLRF